MFVQNIITLKGKQEMIEDEKIEHETKNERHFQKLCIVLYPIGKELGSQQPTAEIIHSGEQISHSACRSSVMYSTPANCHFFSHFTRLYMSQIHMCQRKA